MYDYELTDRGKIVIAIVLVLLLLLVPSAILLFTAIASQPPQPENQGSEVSASPPSEISIIPPPVITESPTPPGDGLDDDTDPDDAALIGSGETGREPSRPLEPGPTGGNPFEGLLSFRFSPDIQSTLDDRTVTMLGEFVRSPKNTDDSIIAVEIPQLPDEDANKLYFALISAFSDLGVAEQRLAYISQPSEIALGSFEVHLSYIPQITK